MKEKRKEKGEKVVLLTVYSKVVWLTVYSEVVWLTVYSKAEWLTVYSKAVWVTVYSKVLNNRPENPQRILRIYGFQVSWQRHSTVVGCQPHAPAVFTPCFFLVLIFSRGWVDPRAMVPSEGKTSLKNRVTPPGIDPGTVLLLAQRLNHCATPGPNSFY